jgi:biopolymer transport protein ExbB
MARPYEAIAMARAVALLAALLFPPLSQAARADEDASATAASAVIASLPHDLSPWSMFMNADIVVKATMVGLAFASLMPWTIWLAKGHELLVTRRRASAAMRILVSTSSLNEAARQIETSATRCTRLQNGVNLGRQSGVRPCGWTAWAI